MFFFGIRLGCSINVAFVFLIIISIEKWLINEKINSFLIGVCFFSG